MDRAQLPLNALRAFEASARHLNFTKAAQELCVSQGAVSQQVALLEARLGAPLFRRLPRGLMLTDEGRALLPVMGDALDRIGAIMGRIEGGYAREVLNLGVVGTFAGGWLLDRLADFARACPHIDLFEADLRAGRLVQPFAACVDLGGYWLTRLMTRPDSPAMADFRHWLIAAASLD
ncbi:LysR family transcriptional regulator [Sphingobium sp. AR-3-1]|uniref:LysR family transcriptional regulator n=1 Tax=Sphingobium psychrophilum TaxID=2728834 RepID=A0A7X9WXR4_9SPHN|nr:LysR family transcriptional regulator [Sphingobium psychrophilum]NML11867.1 LysR family transcriptional regulator [Sphingobium psychrophilum]